MELRFFCGESLAEFKTVGINIAIFMSLFVFLKGFSINLAFISGTEEYVPSSFGRG
jgi:hypothetical protein